MKNLFFLAIAIISLTLTSCQDYIKGEGMVVTENFDLDDFNKIELQASYDVIIKQGTTQEVMVEGQQNLIDRVEMNVSNGNLKLDLQNGSYRNMDLKVHITVPTLEKVFNDGSGDITIEEFEAEDLEFLIKGSGNIDATDAIIVSNKMIMEIDGSGDMELKDLITDDVQAIISGSGNLEIKEGSTKDLETHNSGSGDMKLYDFESDDCIVTSNGSGDTRVKVMNTLDVQLTGSGDVKYKGNPATVDVDDTGSGDVIDAN